MRQISRVLVCQTVMQIDENCNPMLIDLLLEFEQWRHVGRGFEFRFEVKV